MTVDAGAGGLCTYTYDADTSGNIAYNSVTGSVIVTAP
jgi:hypothetical protein